MARRVGVEYMVAVAPPWKRRIPLKLTRSGSPKRSFRYWGNMV